MSARSVNYRIDVSRTRSHTLGVTLTITQPDALQTLSLPVWIPGSYMVREFGRHLSGIRARQGTQVLTVEQQDKTTWAVACSGKAALVVEYEVYAFDTSVRTAFLSTERGFFNNTSVCLRVQGRERQAHRLSLVGLPSGWQVATAMPVDPQAKSAHAFQVADYDELVDHPFEIGPFWRGEFKAGGAVHEFVVAGAWPGFDGARLLRDAQRICTEHIRFWHGSRGKPPFTRYVFMLNAVEDGYGGLEHRASTALIAARRDLPRVGDDSTSEGYLTLLGLISHEYFHTWNVKRLKPVELCTLDYTRENYTRMLWFFEGFTSYFDDLALVRTRLIDGARYLKLLAKTATGVRGMPGRSVQSAAQASLDAWNKYYRQDENTPNATVNYYTKGAQVALALDLSLRREGPGSLDEVMRRLWQRGAARARDPGDIGITEADVAQALEAVGGRSFEAELQAWVHGTQELPLEPLLNSMGIREVVEPAKISARWGLRVAEGPVTGCVVRSVLRGSAAERAGLCAGDEILAIQGWRVRRLDDAAQWLGPPGHPGRAGDGPRAGAGSAAAMTEAVEVLVSRDQRILRLMLRWQDADVGAPTLQWSLLPDAAAQVSDRRAAWWTASG